MPANCPACNTPMKFAGFVSFPKKTIYFCAVCADHHWLEEPLPRATVEQPEQQPQAKLEPPDND